MGKIVLNIEALEGKVKSNFSFEKPTSNEISHCLSQLELLKLRLLEVYDQTQTKFSGEGKKPE